MHSYIRYIAVILMVFSVTLFFEEWVNSDIKSPAIRWTALTMLITSLLLIWLG